MAQITFKSHAFGRDTAEKLCQIMVEAIVINFFHIHIFFLGRLMFHLATFSRLFAGTSKKQKPLELGFPSTAKFGIGFEFQSDSEPGTTHSLLREGDHFFATFMNALFSLIVQLKVYRYRDQGRVHCRARER